MTQDYALLETQPLTHNVPYYHPETLYDVVTEASPATHVFTDFQARPPETIHPDATIQDALEEMQLTKVKSLIVIDDEDQLIGLISSQDLHSTNIGVIARNNMVTVSEITVKMIMTPWNKLQTLSMTDVENARVGHIIRIIQELGVQHLLVMEPNPYGEGMITRGILSATRISRQLGEDIQRRLRSNVVADLNKRF